MDNKTLRAAIVYKESNEIELWTTALLEKEFPNCEFIQVAESKTLRAFDLILVHERMAYSTIYRLLDLFPGKVRFYHRGCSRVVTPDRAIKLYLWDMKTGEFFPRTLPLPEPGDIIRSFNIDKKYFKLVQVQEIIETTTKTGQRAFPDIRYINPQDEDDAVYFHGLYWNFPAENALDLLNEDERIQIGYEAERVNDVYSGEGVKTW